MKALSTFGELYRHPLKKIVAPEPSNWERAIFLHNLPLSYNIQLVEPLGVFYIYGAKSYFSCGADGLETV